MLKKLLSSVLCVLMLLACTTCAFAADKYTALTDADMLTAFGTKMVKKDGSEVVLRGTNLGGWLIMEDWFTPAVSATGESALYNTLVSRFGDEKTRALFKQYVSNWITEKDFDNIADIGMNCVRLPIWYRNFQSDDNGTWYRDENGNIDWSILDQAVAECKAHGLYVIIDLHGVPGYQNNYDHCGKSNSCSFWNDTDEAKNDRAVMKEFWTELASHFAGNPAVAAYDLLNEPLGNVVGVSTTALWDYYDELYDAIRTVDPDHCISMEGIWRPSKLPDPTKYGWTNVLYQLHLYDLVNSADTAAINEAKSSGYNVPWIIGEFYPRDIATFNYILSLYNDSGYSWTTWTYKGMNSTADRSNWFLYGSSTLSSVNPDSDSYDTIMSKWGACLRTDSGNFVDTGFGAYLQPFVTGYIDKASLASGGLFTSATAPNTLRVFINKIVAFFETIYDFFRKTLGAFFG